MASDLTAFPALIAFVTARVDDIEAAAKAVRQPHAWHQGDQSDPWARWDRDMIYMWPPEFHTPVESDKHWRGLQADDDSLAAHIARHDPARVLREVDANRRIIEAAVAAWNATCDPDDTYWVGLAPTLKTLVKNLAAIWCDHPEFRAEWKPS